jgi:hypothetical protein
MKTKRAPTDFTADLLPHNRWEVFWDVIKMRWRTLLLIGAILFAFFLPTMLLMVFRDIYAINLTLAKEQETISEEQALYSSRLVQNVTNLLLIPSLAIFGIGVAGTGRVIRELVWMEGVVFRDDFNLGIKQNWKYSFTIGALSGLMIFLASFTLGNSSSQILGILPLVISQIFFLPVAYLVLSQTFVYSQGFFRYVGNGFQLYFKTAPTTFLATLVMIAPVFLLLIGNLLLKYGLLIFCSVFLFPLQELGYFTYSCWVFDRCINQYQFPSIVDKGIHRRNNSI